MKSKIVDSFQDEVFFSLRRQRNLFGLVASVSVTATLVSTIALALLVPLHEVKPYVVLVDKTTGEAEKIVQVRPASLEQQDVVRQSELVSYITDRETYDPLDNKKRIPDVMERSEGPAAASLASLWSSENSNYPPSVYGSSSKVTVKVTSVTPISSSEEDGVDVAQVRIRKTREEANKKPVTRSFVITIAYTFEPQVESNLLSVWQNPLGFKVTDYRVDAENIVSG